jgi:hypothetical protein
MTEESTLSTERVERLASALARTGRLLDTTSPEAVADTLGWPAVRSFGGDEVRTDVGVPGRDSVVLAFVTQTGKRVFTEAQVYLAEAQPTAGREFVVNAFADAAAALETRFGLATRQRPGGRPMITWHLGRIKESRLPWRRRFATMTLELSPTGHGVRLAVRPEDEAARHAASAAAEAAQAETAQASRR